MFAALWNENTRMEMLAVRFKRFKMYLLSNLQNMKQHCSNACRKIHYKRTQFKKKVKIITNALMRTIVKDIRCKELETTFYFYYLNLFLWNILIELEFQMCSLKDNFTAVWLLCFHLNLLLIFLLRKLISLFWGEFWCIFSRKLDTFEHLWGVSDNKFLFLGQGFEMNTLTLWASLP